MLRIRLSRVGAKKQPSYRIVVADIESKRDGRIVERIGFYNPRTEPIEYTVEEERALYWLSVGAQPSDAVRRLLDKQGTMDRLARLRQGEEMAALVAEFTGEALEEGESLEDAAAQAVDLEIEAAEVVTAEVIEELVVDEEE
jgi:small subunit ribosomal protein S16